MYNGGHFRHLAVDLRRDQFANVIGGIASTTRLWAEEEGGVWTGEGAEPLRLLIWALVHLKVSAKQEEGG